MRAAPSTTKAPGSVTTNPAEAAATGADRATTLPKINSVTPSVFLMANGSFWARPINQVGLDSSTTRAKDLCHRDSDCSWVHRPIEIDSRSAILYVIPPTVVQPMRTPLQHCVKISGCVKNFIMGPKLPTSNLTIVKLGASAPPEIFVRKISNIDRPPASSMVLVRHLPLLPPA
jgi:hypothetical protein